jgi:hypothetical protein
MDWSHLSVPHEKQEDIVNVRWFPFALLQILTMMSVICVVGGMFHLDFDLDNFSPLESS